ncbi:hypothetical protein LINPERPRIM_LOCUS34581 [Linum perenne]
MYIIRTNKAKTHTIYYTDPKTLDTFIPKLQTQSTNSHTQITKLHRSSSTRDLNSLDLRLLNLHLRHRHRQHAVLHRRLHLLHLRILRQPKPPHELPAAPLNSVPRIVLILLLHVPLPADLQHPIVLHFDLHFLLLHPRQIRLEHVRLRRLLPVNSSARERRIFTCRKRQVAEWIHQSRERIEEIASAAAAAVSEEAWNQRHFFRFSGD